MKGLIFLFSRGRRHTRFSRDWSSDVCSSDLFSRIKEGGSKMDNRTDDFYPTRLERPAESFERKDPVIHSQGTDRHNGPLSETELARYERDGFLVFNDFLDQETVKRFRDDLRAYENDDSILRSEGTITEPGKQE